MSEERNRSAESIATSQSVLPSSYPSTSLPALHPIHTSQQHQMPANNNGTSENGNYSVSPPSSTLQTDPVVSNTQVSNTYFPPSNKVPTSNGQPIQRRGSCAANTNHNSQISPSDQHPASFTESRSANSTPTISQNDNLLDSNLITSSNLIPNPQIQQSQQIQQNDTNSFHQNEAVVLPANISNAVNTSNAANTSNTTQPVSTGSTAYKAQITTTSLKPKAYNSGDKIPTVVDQIEPSTSIPSTVTTTSSKNTTKATNPRVRTPARSKQKGGEPKTPRSANQQANATASQPQTSTPSSAAGTKRPHPNQYTYPTAQAKDSRAVPPYQRYNSVAVPVSSQVHHGAHQQVQYSIPASNYGSPKIYVQSQGQSSVPSSATYTLHQRSGANTLAQRTSVPSSGTGQPQVIIQCRPDQQPYSQGQPSNQHFIIQTQQQQSQVGESPSNAVYQQRPSVRAGQEAQRQYIQTLQNGPSPSSQSTVTSVHSQQTSGVSGQPQVLHIQFHQGDLQPGQQKVLIQQQPGPPTSTVQQQLIDKSRVGQLPNGPQQSIDQQAVLTSSASNVHLNQHPSSSSIQQQQSRAKAVRTLIPQVAVKQEESFEEMNMHPSQLPLPDSFNSILDQIHSSGESPKAFYRKLKKQFKYLVYENECYQEELRNSQRHLLKLSRDKNFLLDRLLNYESAEELENDDSDADSDATIEEKPKPKKKKVQPPRKRNNTAASKKAAAKSTLKPEDEASQASVDSAGIPNSQASTSAHDSHSFPQFSDPSIASTSAHEK